MTLFCFKCGLIDVFQCDHDLMEASTQIQFWKILGTTKSVKRFIRARNWRIVMLGHVVERAVVDHSSEPHLLYDKGGESSVGRLTGAYFHSRNRSETWFLDAGCSAGHNWNIPRWGGFSSDSVSTLWLTSFSRGRLFGSSSSNTAPNFILSFSSFLSAEGFFVDDLGKLSRFIVLIPWTQKYSKFFFILRNNDQNIFTSKSWTRTARQGSFKKANAVSAALTSLFCSLQWVGTRHVKAFQAWCRTDNQTRSKLNDMYGPPALASHQWPPPRHIQVFFYLDGWSLLEFPSFWRSDDFC